MTVLRDDLPVDSHEAPGRRAWIRPAVQQLDAGSAEDGFGSLPDAQNPS
jgi:hypothetical protein